MSLIRSAHASGFALEFDDEEHRYYIDSERVPAVSDVLEPLNQLEGIPLDVLEAARIRGHHGHHAIALDIHKQLVWQTLDPKLVGYVEGAKKFIAECEVRVLAVEYRMGDPGLKVGGTLDVMGIVNKNQAIIDWKLVDKMPRSAALQTAAYDHLYRRTYGGRPLKRFGVQLPGDGTYKIFEFKDPRDTNWFMSALNLWHWKHS